MVATVTTTFYIPEFTHAQWRAEVLGSPGQRGSWMPGAGQIPTFFCPEENLHFPTNFSIF